MKCNDNYISMRSCDITDDGDKKIGKGKKKKKKKKSKSIYLKEYNA